MGAVFAAFDRVRDEEIAVKVLLPHLLADPKARERFLNEAKVAGGLSHPNIVRVFDVQQTAGLTFLTMERLQGRSLREEIARRQQTAERFTVAEVLTIASRCATPFSTPTRSRCTAMSSRRTSGWARTAR